MRKLTQREKILIGIVAVVVAVVLVMGVAPAIRERFSGSTLATKRAQLQTAQELVSLAQITQPVQEKLRSQAGLQGQIISDSLFTELSDKVRPEQLNRARRASDLAALHPALKEKAESLLAYRKQEGNFENLDTLKKIQGPIFEGEQPQAVISRQLSDLAQRAGLRPNYQLNIKPMSGKKTQKIPAQAKKNLVLYLYMSELEEELKALQAQQRAVEEAVTRKEAAALDAVFDAWWGDDEVSVDDTSDEANAPTVVEKKEAEIAPSAPAKPVQADGSSQPDRQFAQLPETIPVSVWMQLIPFIQSNLRLQLVGAVESKKGFLEEQITVVNGEAKGGFLGIGAKKGQTQAKFTPESVLLSKFEELMGRYQTEPGNDTSEGEAGNAPVDVNAQRNALANYVDSIRKQKEKLNGWFAKVPASYQPEEYLVEMSFKGEIDKIVRLVQSIDSSLKWLSVRGLRISIADKNQTLLSAELSMVAKIL